MDPCKLLFYNLTTLVKGVKTTPAEVSEFFCYN